MSSTNSHDRRREFIGALTLLCVIVAGFARSANGQFLDLSEAPRPPELEDFTYCSELIGELETEIAGLIAQQRGADPVHQVTLRASITVRITAADLLAAGESAGPDGSMAVLYGVTLADGRDDIDQSLRQLRAMARRIANHGGDVDPQLQQQFTEALRLVKLFNDTAVDQAEQVRTADLAELNDRLPMILSPLADAVELLDGVRVQSYWVPTSSVQFPAAMMARSPADRQPNQGVRRPPTIDQLEQRAEVVPMRDDLRAELKLIIDFLRRGSEFPELRPKVNLYQQHVAEVLALAEALANAQPWLDAGTQQAYFDRMRTGILLFKDPRTRDRGQRYIDRLEASRSIIDRISTLRSMKRDRRSDFDPIVEAFLAADAMAETAAHAERGRRQLLQLTAVLDRMIEYRELQDVDLRRDLRVVHKQLQDRYEDAESALLDEISTLSAEPDAMSDPAFVSLLNDQQQYLEDLKRVRQIPQWVETVSLIEPDAGGPFYAQARKMTLWLLEPNRRPDAVRAMRRFEQQLSLFHPLPFEQELTAGSPDAVAASAGLHQQLLRHALRQRRQWAQAWGDGDAASAATNRLLLLYRLLLVMKDTTEVLRLQGDASLLNRWAGWETTPEVIARAISDLPARLKLATNAAIDGNDQELRRNLDRIDDDMPLAKLMGRLTAMLGSALTDRPGNAAATCGQLIHQPTAQAWFDQHRPKLADICRYALEQEYSRATGRAELSAEIRTYVNTLSVQLLELLGDQRQQLPALHGFDGSDPMPNVNTPGMQRR